MCAINDDQMLAELRIRTERIIAWKMLLWPSMVAPWYPYYKYQAGWNIAKRYFSKLDFQTEIVDLPPDYQYSRLYPAGIHAYVGEMPDSYHIHTKKADNVCMQVEIEPADVIACESRWAQPRQQIVARKVWVDPKEWARVEVIKEQ